MIEENEYFRGDTIFKELEVDNYKFQKDDIIKVAVMVDEDCTNHLFDDTIVIQEEQNTVLITIPPEKTSQFQIGTLILEIELTYGGGIVHTEQYPLEIKGDGICEQNKNAIEG